MKTVRMNRWGFATGMIVCSMLAAIGAEAPVRGQYRVIDLGRLAGFRSEARGINARGDIAGLTTTDTGYQAARWRWDTTNYVIQALGKGEAYGIADDGTVAGLSDSVGGTLWAPSGAPTSLGLDNRFNAISASGIPAGWISFTITNPNPPSNVKFPKHAAWFAGASGIDLAQRPEWDCVVAGVDRVGIRWVGSVLTNVFAGGPTHAWLFPGRDLHTLTGFATSFALAVNSSTQVVGRVNSGPFSQPMFWSEATGMRLLYRPDGTPYGSALGINDAGQAVGALGSGAVLWSNVGQTNETNVFLSDLLPFGHGWTLQVAHAINNRGEIVGYGLSPTGGVNGFCLVPTNIVTRTIEGSVVVLAHELFGDTTTNRLEEVQLELVKSGGGALWIHLENGFADMNGNFRFTVREPLDAQFAVRVKLADRLDWLMVCHEAIDPDNPAWMQTIPFTATSDGARADIRMFINEGFSLSNPNIATYYLNGQAFNLGGSYVPSDLGASSAPPGLPMGDSSVNHFEFAPLAVIYRNLRLSERFARDELLMSVSPVKAMGFSTRHTSWGPTPGRPTIFINIFDTLYNIYFAGGKRRSGNRPTNREFHEYGHHIMWMSPLNITPFILAGTNSHGGLRNSSSSGSWVEGFAEFIGTCTAARMLDDVERGRVGLYRVGGQLFDFEHDDFIDDPIVPRRQGAFTEEHVVATLLWDLFDGKGNEPQGGAGAGPFDNLQLPLDVLVGDVLTRANVTNVSQLHLELRDYADRHPTEMNKDDVSWRFVLAGIYDDWSFADGDPRNTNGLHNVDEIVGVTSWNTNFLHRPNYEPELSAYIRVNAFDDAGAPLSDVRADFRTISAPPWNEREITNAFILTGMGPWEFPVLPPPPPASLLIRLSKPGLRASAELAIDAEWFQLRQDNAGPDEVLLEHSFTLARASLRVTRRPDGLMEISWPADVSGAVLEFAPTLPSAIWTPAPTPPILVGEDYRVTFSPTDATRFFRLRAP